MFKERNLFPKTSVLLMVALVALSAAAQGVAKLTPIRREAKEERVRLATTTSTENSGLLSVLLPPFEEKFGVKVDVIAAGTGKALKLGENGDVDVVLVHNRDAEDDFISAGLRVSRRDVMYNDFIIVGPPDDPAGIRSIGDAVLALRKIAESKSPFISRGDESGTHKREKALWREAGITPEGRWYSQVGQGMGETLQIAFEKRAYALADRGTFVAYRDKVDLEILVEGDGRLYNPYGIIAVNPAKHPHVKYISAMLLIAWVTSPEGQEIIAKFTKDGEVLFHPIAVPHPFERRSSAEFIWERTKKAFRLMVSPNPEVWRIAFLSLRISLGAVILASALAIPIGFTLGVRDFRGKRFVVTVLNTSMALPTVVVGLTVYSFLSQRGLLGNLKLLYTPWAMLVGQFVLATPIISALSLSAVEGLDKRARPTTLSLGANAWQSSLTLLREVRFALLASVVSGFGRIISEVGAAMMLRGNIEGYTRTLTTAIALETSKGEFGFGIALGIILLIVAFTVNGLLYYLQKVAGR
ncbi:MAG: ABC transporter permease [bacterium]